MEVLGVLLGAAALIVAVVGVLDVREQVRHLVKLEMNRGYSRVIHKMIWEFVDPTESTPKREIAEALHDFVIVAQTLEPKKPADVLRITVENESLQRAQELVNNGTATWKTDMDVEMAKNMITTWLNEKNIARVNKMLGGKNSLV
jgi:post-segregation antitoxin (ccd killing protein)